MSKSSLPMPPPPPLLLTKRVTAFLRANLSPSITTAMLTTPAGNLLSHSSPLPASALRRQCAVAASIWAVQSSSSSSSPFPSSSSSPSSPRRHQSSSSPRRHQSSSSHRKPPPSLTVQLDSGLVFIIRRLKCGMLFVCMGPGQQSTPQQQQQQSISAAMEPGEARQGEGEREREGGPTPIGSPSTSSEVGRASVVSAGTTSGQTVTSQTSTATVSSAGVVMMRRQVEELARWLDERLGGLCIPEEGIGMEGWQQQQQQQQHQQHQHQHQQQQQGREQLEIR